MICQNFKGFFRKKNNIFPRTQEKFSKLKKKLKTQGKNSTSGRTCPLPPSQVVLKKAWSNTGGKYHSRPQILIRLWTDVDSTCFSEGEEEEDSEDDGEDESEEAATPEVKKEETPKKEKKEKKKKDKQEGEAKKDVKKEPETPAKNEAEKPQETPKSKKKKDKKNKEANGEAKTPAKQANGDAGNLA